MFKLLVLVSVVVCVFGSAVPRSLPKLDGRIVGGEETSISSFPYQISFIRMGTHFCGGSLIAPNIVVTAAHCVFGFQASECSIRAGSSSKRSGGILVQVESLAWHPKFNYTTKAYDAAVLKLASSLPLGGDIGTIQLVKKAPADGTTAVVSGWGTEYSGQPFTDTSAILRAASVKIISHEVCSSIKYAYGSRIKPTMICAASPGKDACDDDSGGPLVVEEGLAGIVSWGYGCAMSRYPHVYTDISSVYEWILTTAKSFQ